MADPLKGPWIAATPFVEVRSGCSHPDEGEVHVDTITGAHDVSEEATEIVHTICRGLSDQSHSRGVQGATVRLLPGSDVELACGSIIARVAAGSGNVEIVLSNDTSLFVAANQTAEVETSAGSFTVRDVSGTGGSTLRLVSGGTETQVGESGSSISLYDFFGFTAPIVNAETGKFNGAKPGSTATLKWRLLSEAGLPVTNLASASVSVQSLAGCTPNAQPLGTPNGGSTSALVHLGNGYYQLNWKTDKKWTGCKLMTLSLASEGPITHNALFKFT